MEMNTILEGLLDDVIENIGQCVPSKVLCDKIKDLYLDENPNEEYQSEQSSIYNHSSGEDPSEEDSNIEAEVNLEVEIVSALDDLREYK